MWVAQALSLLGNQFAQVAISLLVYERTHSAFLTALAYALTFVPQVAGGPLLSGLADLVPRRLVMICCDLLRAVAVAVMAIPGSPFWELCVLIGLISLAGVPFSAARMAMLPDILPGDKLVLGSAIGNTTDQFSQVVGFAVGAVVVATLDPHGTLLVDAATFVISAFLIAARVRPRPTPPRQRSGQVALWSLARTGMELVWRNTVIRLLVLFGWLAGFYALPEALAAPYAHSLGKGAVTVGLLMAAMPAGTVIGTLILLRLIPPSRRLGALGWLAMLATAPLIGSAARPPLLAVLGLWALAGMGNGYQVIAAAEGLRRLPDSGRGAAVGVISSGLLAVQGIGFLVGGAVAQVIGPQDTVAASGAAGLAVAAILTLAWSRASQGEPDATAQSPGSAAAAVEPRAEPPADVESVADGQPPGPVRDVNSL